MRYIQTESNHPPSIIKHIPASIQTRLSNLSSTETIFKESTAYYENNLQVSGHNKKLTYKPTDTNHQRHSKHKRKIMWFNPPFSKNISTEVFSKLVRPTFPKKPHLQQHIQQKQNQSKLQLHGKHKISYKQPQCESFKQYR